MDDTSSAVVEAPVSAPSSSPTSSEPSTPVDATPTTDRPSFKEALDVFNEAARQQGKRTRGRSAASSPTDPSAAVQATTRPDGQPEPTPHVLPPASSQGPVPLAVHQKAIENARTKTATEVESRIRQEYGQASPQVVSQAMQWFTAAARDRVGFLRDVISEALTDPDLAAQVRSLAGRTLGGRAAEAPTDEPRPDFQDGQGNQFYSAKAQQAREAWLIQQLKTEILGEVQPGLREVQTLKAERDAERMTTQTKQTMGTYLSDARTWPQFKEHEAEIRQALLSAPQTDGHPASEALLLRRIYDSLVGPKLSQLQQTQWLAQLKRDANASSVNPASTGAPTGIPKNVAAKTGGTMADAMRWAATQTSGR